MLSKKYGHKQGCGIRCSNPTTGLTKPDYPVCKSFLDNLIQLCRDLELNFIFVHGDEQVYAKLAHILWKNPELYKKIIPLMGGFHELRVMQKIGYKRFGAVGFKQWCKDAGVIACGSADKAFEGGHYYGSMRIHKEMFCAIVFDALKNSFPSNEIFDEILIKVMDDPSPSSLQRALENDTFINIFQELTATTGTQSQLFVQYLKDVSCILSLVRAVRDNDFLLHLQAELKAVHLCQAFDHVHYKRYLSKQIVHLNDLKFTNSDAFNALKN